MLKKQNRLARVSQRAKGNILTSSLFTVKTSENENKESRFGFVASKKISKSAVLRNRTKRVLKKIIEENLEKIPSSKNIVIVAKKSFSWEEKGNAGKALMSILEKIK